LNLRERNMSMEEEEEEEEEEKHNEELHNSYYSPHIRLSTSRRMRWARHVACMGEMRNEYKILVTEHQRKCPLGKMKCR